MHRSSRPGIYIHIPFCEKKCDYCDFYSLVSPDRKPGFLQSLAKEIEIRSSSIDQGVEFDTLYAGGGTPSLLSPKETEFLIKTASDQFRLTDDAEVTFEMNPESVTREKLILYKLLGINRISLGIQSFLPHELSFLGRIHSAEQSVNAFRLIRDAGFDNISIDLIYALPDQTLDEWRISLEHAVALEPEHISAYSLIYEEGTPLQLMLIKNRIQAWSADEEYDFFNLTTEVLEAAGYRQYEVSNFARKDGLYSRHNSKYWDHSPYLGFGPSAHSFWGGKRWSNIRSLSLYQKKLKRNVLPVDFCETLNEKTMKFERIFLSLRTTRGIDLDEYERRHSGSFAGEYHQLVGDLTAAGLAVLDKTHFRLTKKGLCLCDEILPNFIPV